MSWGSERSLSVGSHAEAMLMGSPLSVMSPGDSFPTRVGCGYGDNNVAISSVDDRHSSNVSMVSPKSPSWGKNIFK